MPEEVQKIDRSALWMLGILILIVLGIGIWQVRYQLFTQDRVKAAIIADIQEKIGTNSLDEYLAQTDEAAALAELQTKDTDADGISDFQEQYVYATSPYLADSDSDTIPDLDEITAGTNPNCPEGTECTQERTNTNGVTIDAENALKGLTSQQIAAIKKEVTPAELRKQLLSSGVPQTELDKYTDVQLMELFEASLGGSSSTSNPQSAVDAQAAAIRSMTIEQKKQLLLQAGVSNTTIQSLTDEQITALVEQAVQDAYASVTLPSNTNVNSNSNTNS